MPPMSARLAPGAMSYAVGVSGTVNLTGALPDLSGNLRIEGPGADQFTVRGTRGRLSHLHGWEGSEVFISGITISGGDDPGGSAAASSTSRHPDGERLNHMRQLGLDGGGIYNVSIPDDHDSTISGNYGRLPAAASFPTPTSGTSRRPPSPTPPLAATPLRIGRGRPQLRRPDHHRALHHHQQHRPERRREAGWRARGDSAAAPRSSRP